MKKEEINLNNLDDYDYEDEVVDELNQSIQEGEYEPGKVYSGQFPDDLADVIENLLFLQENSEVTFKVRKDPDDYHINFEIVSRK